MGNRAIEQRALKEKSVSEKKNKVVKVTPLKVEQEESTEKTEIIKTPSTPSEDKAFQRTIRYVKKSGDIQKEHDDAGDKLIEVENSSRLKVSEQQKNNNQKAHQKIIEKKSAKKDINKHKFTAQGFKDILRENLKTIEGKLPHSEGSAKNFKKNKPLEILKNNVSKKIKKGKEKMVGPLETEAQKKNIEKVDGAEKVTREDAPKDIPEVIVGIAPKPINRNDATPKPKHKSEISMEKESRSLDDMMEESNVSESQLANSNEPEFLEALDSKNQAQTEAKQAPLTYRINENNRLIKAKNYAAFSGKQGLNAMFKSRSESFEKVHSRQTSSQVKNITKKKEINKRFETIYTLTKDAVTTRLNSITTDVDKFFEEQGKIGKAKKTFEKNVENKLNDIYGWSTLDDKLISYIVGRDINANEIDKVFVSEKKLFITKLNSAFDEIAILITTGLTDAITLIDTGKILTDILYNGLSIEEKKLADDSLEIFNDRYESLKDTVSAKEKELARSLAKRYKQTVDGLKETFDKIKEKVSAGWIEGAINAIKSVIKTIKKLRKLISSLLSEIKAFLPIIMNDPIGFAKKLFAGIGKGIERFKENIKKHLLGGFVKWLTGAMGDMKITIPDNLFSLKGIFSLVMQILGLGWDYLREKSVKLLGEPVVKAMEKGLEMFKTLRTKGVAGIWEYLKDQFNDLKKTIIDEIQSMLITQVLIAGVKWLVSLLVPGGGFIKAIMSIKDLIVFFVESAVMLIPSLISSIKALALGNVKGIAKVIEKGLGLLIVLVINLFAKLIGLGGLAKKVMKIIERIRKRIDKAIDKLIYKAKKAFKGLLKKGKGKGKEKAKRKSKKGKIDKTLGEKLTFLAGKERHKLWITNIGNKIKIMVASENPGPVEKRLQDWTVKLSSLNEEDQLRAKKHIAGARALTKTTMGEAKEELLITKVILKDREVTSAEAKKESKAEKETIVQEKKLKIHLLGLFRIFGYDPPDLLVKYKTEINRLIFKDDIILLYKKLDEKSLKTIQDWRGFVTLLNTKKLHDIVFTKNHKFDTELRGKNIAKKALKNIQTDKEKKKLWIKYQQDNKNKTEEDFIVDRIQYIRKNIRNSLQNYMLTRNRSTLIEILEMYFIKSLGKQGASEHLEYKPVIKKIKKEKNKFIIGYGYDDVQEKNKKSFEVSFDFSKIDDEKSSETTQTTQGKNLTLKKEGTRGKTESSGKLINKSLLYKQFLKDKEKTFNINDSEEELKKKVDVISDEKALNQHFKKKAEAKGLKTLDSNLFDSAHLVADWFSGSGYKDALNLTVTSAEYNRQTMGDAEKNIATKIKNVEKESIFDLTVAAKWDILQDKEIMKDVNALSILKQLNQNSKIQNTDNKELALQATKELSRVLLEKQDPRRVLSVKYDTTIKVPNEKKLEDKKIGCDIWMSSYFDFDKKKECEYNGK